MTIYLQLDLAANEIVSVGRLITRCYKQRNSIEFRGHLSGSLECHRAVGTSRSGGQRYLIELVEVDPATRPQRQELVDFSVFDRGAEIAPPEVAVTRLGLPALSRVPGGPPLTTEGADHHA